MKIHIILPSLQYVIYISFDYLTLNRDKHFVFFTLISVRLFVDVCFLSRLISWDIYNLIKVIIVFVVYYQMNNFSTIQWNPSKLNPE
jgi:hypothetical protein